MAFRRRRKSATRDDRVTEPPAAQATGAPRDRAPRVLRLASDWAWRVLLVAALVALVLWLLREVTLVTVAFIIGVLLTALLHPFVGVLGRARVPRALATVIVFVVGLAVLVGVGFFVANQVSTNSAALVRQFNDVVEETQAWLTNGPLHVRSEQIQRLTQQVGDALNKNWQEIVTGAVTGISTGIEALAGVALALFCTFFLLLDGGKIWNWFTRMFPAESREPVHSGGEVAWRTLSNYVRGTVIIAFVDAVAVTITLLVAQVPLAVPVGVLVFLGAFIPVLGLTITGAFAVALALVSHGLIVAVIVLGVIVLAVQVESNVLQPAIMSRAVRVHPLGVILAVSAGTIVSGIFGAVIAVPVVAVLNNVITHRAEGVTAQVTG